MIPWRAYPLTVALALSPVAGLAQEDDRGFITNFLEERLSGAGRQVILTGFEGALSSRATIEQLTIADADGVWLTIEDAAVSWNRSALLSGRVEVGELSAGRIEVARLPRPSADPGLPDAAATPFRIPDLPVSVNIDTIQAETLFLADPILGEDISMTLAGALSIEGGEGAARLSVERTDQRAGALSLDASFANETEFLDIDLSLDEPQDGIAARLLNLPGRPALAMAVVGQGPLSDFAADIALASDGEDRLTGSFTLSQAETGPEAAPAPRRFTLDVAGDVTPLFAPEFQEFFGPDVQLFATGEREPGGEARLERLAITAAAVELEGSLTLAADGLPEAFALEGVVAAPDGQPVRLPAEVETFVDEARIDLSFDAAQGEEWSGSAHVRGLTVMDNRLGEAVFTSSGQIGRSDDSGIARRVAGRFSLEAEGIALANPALAEAVGPRLEAATTFLWREGQPLSISNAAVATETFRTTLTGQIGDIADALPLTARGSANVSDLSAFSALTGRPLAGRVILGVNGTTRLLDGRFDGRASGVARNLSLGIEPLDRAIAGESDVALDVRRDETGITLRQFDVTTGETRLSASGLLQAGQTNLTASARVDEAGRLIDGLSGPVALRAAVRETVPGTYTLSASGEAPGDAILSFEGRLLETPEGSLTATGELTTRVAQLSAYAAAAGRRLGGAVDLAVTGEAALSDDLFDVTVDLSGTDLAVGVPTADRLLGGRVTLEAAARRLGDTVTIRGFQLATREVTADLSGVLGRRDARVEGTARLRNVGLFAPDFPGPADVRGVLSRATDGRWGIDVRATGPGNTTATVTGSAAPTGETVDLTLNGEAPLGLANAALAPRAVRGRATFDLAVRGRPALGSVSGRISTSGARLVAPTYGLAVAGISGGATLSGARAQIDLAGGVEGGGQVSVGGSVALSGLNDASLRVRLANARISDPDLFETTVSGEVTVTGPLRGAGLVGGVLRVGPTEVRVAPTGSGAGGELRGLRHINEPAAVRLTRLRAGFEGGAGGGPGGAARRSLNLDLLIDAPNQIFVRGRGLDAELGGRVRLRGTTRNIAPQGQFDLIRGRLDILGRRLALDEGFARLEGSFDPFVRLVATTEAEDITVRVAVEGFVSNPDIRFESSPELPEDEVLARLFFGRGITELSPLQAAQLASAVASLAGSGGAGLVGGLRESFGLDDLDITTDTEGNAAVRAGRYLSENVYTDVTIGSDGQADISINLDVSRSVTVKGSVDSDGETGLGIFYERDY